MDKIEFYNDEFIRWVINNQKAFKEKYPDLSKGLSYELNHGIPVFMQVNVIQ